MFTKSGTDPVALDSVVAAEGTFRFRPGHDTEPVIEVVMVYTRKETGDTFGTCPIKTSVLSKETKDAFLKFLELAEGDFGKVVFGSGVVAPAGKFGLGQAESTEGLKPKGLGEG